MPESVLKFAEFIRAYDVIVWDWNGTLLNDSFFTHKVISKIMQDEGLKPISIEEYRKNFGFPIATYYASIGLPSSGPDFDRIANLFVEGYRAYNNDLKLFEDAVHLLETVKKSAKKQYVLSAAHHEDLQLQMGRFDIKEYFNDVSGASDIYAHGKIDQARVMKIYFDKKGYKKGLYIGDTDHDYEVSQVLGFDFCFSQDGHQCPTRLDLTKVSHVLSNRNQ